MNSRVHSGEMCYYISTLTDKYKYSCQEPANLRELYMINSRVHLGEIMHLYISRGKYKDPCKGFVNLRELYLMNSRDNLVE